MPVLKRPDQLGSIWMSGTFVHGPRFVQPEKIADDSYIIRGNPNRVRTKLGRLKEGGTLVIQSRLRPIYPGELPLLKQVIPHWIIDLGKFYNHQLFVFYTFYFTQKEAKWEVGLLKGRGYRVRVIKRIRKQIPIYLIYRYKPGRYEEIPFKEVLNQ